jgi:RimJ/RimL family protein N-acetyltransferase
MSSLAAFTAGRFAFLPVTADDLPMLAEWLARPHWREWWGDPVTQLGYIRDMLEGRDPSHPFIFRVDGKPAGYIQHWSIGLHQTPEWTGDNPWLLELPAEAVGIDLSLADGDKLSHGIGSAALRAFASALLDIGNRTVIIDPDPANGRAVNAYHKAGFRPVPHLEGRTQGVLIMQFHPETDPS